MHGTGVCVQRTDQIAGSAWKFHEKFSALILQQKERERERENSGKDAAAVGIQHPTSREKGEKREVLAVTATGREVRESEMGSLERKASQWNLLHLTRTEGEKKGWRKGRGQLSVAASLSHSYVELHSGLHFYLCSIHSSMDSAFGMWKWKQVTALALLYC